MLQTMPRVYHGVTIDRSGCVGRLVEHYEPTYPFHDTTITVTHCGRICFKGQKVNLSHAFAGQNVGVTQVGERIWLVTFMQYDLGYFDDETCRLEPIENPFGPKVLPMCPEWTEGNWLAALDDFRNWLIREAA
jgi:hypothetical protein